MRGGAASLSFGVGVVIGACTSDVFVCGDDSECGSGICESSGYCSYEDNDCESGRRYGNQAPAGIAGQCTQPSGVGGTDDGATSDATDGGGPATGSGSGAVEDTASVDDATDAGSTGADTTTDDGTDTGSDSSTGGPGIDPPAPLVCGGGSFNDDFSTDALDSWWNATVINGEIVTNGSTLLARVFADAESGDAFVGSVTPHPVQTAMATLEVLQGDTADLSYAYLSFGGKQGGVTFVLYEGELSGRVKVAGDDVFVEGVPYDPDAHRWLRMQTGGDVATWMVSSDGVDWSVLAQYEWDTPPIGATTGVFIGAGHASPSLEGDLLFEVDNFELCIPEP